MPRASRVLARWSSFERVRTELCYAERLRRVRRTTEAHAHFRSALGTFEQLGAEPWALRARRGLARQGSRGRRATPLDAPLSAHESQVAGLVQRGATNRQVAATLFVTEKTVEYHLSNIYRKLGIRSRAELAWVLAKRPPEPGGHLPRPRQARARTHEPGGAGEARRHARGGDVHGRGGASLRARGQSCGTRSKSSAASSRP